MAGYGLEEGHWLVMKGIYIYGTFYEKMTLVDFFKFSNLFIFY